MHNLESYVVYIVYHNLFEAHFTGYVGVIQYYTISLLMPPFEWTEVFIVMLKYCEIVQNYWLFSSPQMSH